MRRCRNMRPMNEMRNLDVSRVSNACLRLWVLTPSVLPIRLHCRAGLPITEKLRASKCVSLFLHLSLISNTLHDAPARLTLRILHDLLLRLRPPRRPPPAASEGHGYDTPSLASLAHIRIVQQKRKHIPRTHNAFILHRSSVTYRRVESSDPGVSGHVWRAPRHRRHPPFRFQAGGGSSRAFRVPSIAPHLSFQC